MRQLDWNKLLGFDQIASDRRSVTKGTAPCRIAAKIGNKDGLKEAAPPQSPST